MRHHHVDVDAASFAHTQLERFHVALSEPQAVQAQFLAAMLRTHAGCGFGQAHDFSRLRTLNDYRAAVPVADYEVFRPAIHAAVHERRQGELTSTPIRRFFLTSGSSSAPKHIPVTGELIAAKSRAFAWYWAAALAQHTDVPRRDIVTNFSDAGGSQATPGGLPVSSESAFWAEMTRRTQLGRPPFVPPEVARLRDGSERAYAIARALLTQSFRGIMTLNPSTVELLFRTVQSHMDELIDDLLQGRRGPANVARAHELQNLAQQGPVRAHRVWPGLRLCVCWRSPMLTPYLELLAPHLHGVAQRDYILMASEAVMAVPLEDGTSGSAPRCLSSFHSSKPKRQTPKPCGRTSLKLALVMSWCSATTVAFIAIILATWSA